MNMEVIVPVVVSDLVCRLVSKLVHTYQEREHVGQKLRKLHLMLLKIHASIDEAEQRFIANQLILLQLKVFREAMCQGYYLLDTFESRATETEGDQDTKTAEGDQDAKRNHLYSISSFNPCKRIRRMSNVFRSMLLGDKDMSKLQEMICLLEDVDANVLAFNTLVSGYPRRPRRPYDTYLYISNCLFGRHAEKEQIINFLLEQDDDSTDTTQALSVLPIIGRHRSGKKTLMESVCRDERVRSHFSWISFLDGDDLEGEMLETTITSRGEGMLITNHDLQLKRCLFVVEFALNVDQESWGMFYRRASNLMKGSGSKIVIISSLREAEKLGTKSPMILRILEPEQFWYFFKAIAFGSTNPKEHPRLLSIGMQINAAIDGGFPRGQWYGGVLRENLDVHTWSLLLSFAKKAQKGDAHYGSRYKAVSIYTVGGTEASHSCVFRRSRMDVVNGKLPELTVHDVMSLGCRPKVAPTSNKFDALVWRSILPPYRVYVKTYETLDESDERKVPIASNETLDDMDDKLLRVY